MISKDMRELILSQLRGGIKFIQVVENFKSVCSKSTVVRILSESKARMPILKKRGPAKKIDRSMERRLVRALTIGKRPATIRRSAKKEQVSERTVRRMLNRKAVKVFKKKEAVPNHDATCRSPKVVLSKISEDSLRRGSAAYGVGG